VGRKTAIKGEFGALERALASMDLEVTAESLEALAEYRRAMLKWNRRVNLVSRGDEQRIIRYHFLDSAAGLVHLRAGDLHVLDMGAGAGFPGVVWKILRPRLEMTLVDSVRKRCLFLESVAEGLGLKGVSVVRERGEVLAEHPDFVQRFDAVTARTVARLSRLVDWCVPLLRPGGRLVAFKGVEVEEELEDAAPALRERGGRVVEVAAARPEGLREKRAFVVIEKSMRL
jgi:16S rRNA (guanine527-N7)-methyltransferase